MEKNHKLLKRFLAFLLSAAMIITYMPVSMIAYAAEEDVSGEPVVEQQVEEEASAAVEPVVEEPAPAEEPAAEEPVVEEPAEEESSPEAHPSEETAKPSGGENKADEAIEAEEAEAEEEVTDEFEAGTLTWDKASSKYKVVVSYDASAEFPKGATLKLKEFDENDKEFKEAKQALVDDKDGNSPYSQATEEEQEELGMAAFDLTIYDKDNNPIEPAPGAKVQVNVELKEMPEGAEVADLAESMEIQHLNESSGDVVVEKVATVDSQEAKKDDAVGEIKVDEKKETVEVKTVVEGFSTYTITWRTNPSRTVTVKYVDENGTELNISNASSTYGNLTANSPDNAYLIYDINGYEYVKTERVSNGTTTEIRPLLTKNNQDRWRYTTTTGTGNNVTVDWNELSNGDVINVVYKKKPAITAGGTPTLKPVDPDDKPAAPTILKESDPNGDGTAEMSLSITGYTKDREVEKLADVIVIMDVSGSMNREVDSNSNGTSRYNSQTGKWTGTCRLDNAKNAVNNLADELSKRKDSQGNPLVRMSLIDFSNTASEVIGLTDLNATGLSSYKDAVNGLSADGGTNWEEALRLANQQSVDDGRATFVIFVTDGDPTFRRTRYDIANNGFNNDISSAYYRTYGVFGEGSSDSNSRNYNAAVTEGLAITNANKNLYTIGISDSVTKVSNFNTAVKGDGAYLASNAAALNQAFTDIQNSIAAKMGVSDIQMTDGITDMTQTVEKSGLTGTDGNFTYWKKGKDETSFSPWTPSSEGCAEAVYNEETGAVEWNMGTNFMPEDGATYKVTWRVWPSQEAYDILAKCKNDPTYYDTLSTAQKAQIKRSGTAPNYTYELKTNEPGAGTKYKDATKTGNGITTEGDYITLPFNEVDDLGLASRTISIQKFWDNDLGDGRGAGEDPITFQILAGEEVFGNVTLEYNEEDESKSWRYDNYNISTGLMTTTGGQQIIYEHGHDFVVVEPAELDYYWDFHSDVFHPMVINNQTVMLIKVDTEAEADYTIDGSYYKIQEGEALLHAINERRSHLNLSKTVLNAQGAAVDSQTGEFTFKVTVTESKGEDVWFSVFDPVTNATVKDSSIASGEGIVYQESDGYFHIPSGTEITLKLKNKWNARFLNLHKESTYTIEETAMTPGYEFVSATTSANNSGTPGTVTNKTTTGTIDKSNVSYSVNYNNTQTETSKSVEKRWADSNDISTYGITSVTVKLKNITENAIVGTYDLVAAEDWKHTFTGLPMYTESGIPIVYEIVETVVHGTVDGSAKDVTDLFKSETTEDEDGNTIITNTRETTTVVVNKVWDDNNDQDGIRDEVNATIQLYKKVGDADRVAVGSPVNVLATDNWSNTWTDLPVYEKVDDEYVQIIYSVEETLPNGSKYTIKDGENNGNNKPLPAVKDETETATITNTHTPSVTSVKATKTWSDNSDQDGKRPADATVQLYKNGEAYGDPVTVPKDGGEITTWNNLPVYEDGEAIVYTVVETLPDGSPYTKAGDGDASAITATETTLSGTVAITNSYTPSVTSVKATKTWSDNSDQDGKRPADATVQLYKNGEAYGDPVTVPKDGGEITTWNNLPVYEDGEAIVYTVVETLPDGSPYTKAGDGDESAITAEEKDLSGTVAITNSYTPEQVTYSGEKKWEDVEGKEGPRPDSITFGLYIVTEEAGKKMYELVEEVVALAADNYEFEFKPVDKYANGAKIIYEVLETAVTGYTNTDVEVVDNGDNTYSVEVTNTRDTGKLILEKEVRFAEGSAQTAQMPGTAKFTVTGPKDFGDKVVDGKGVAEITYSQFTDGKYVFEDAPTGDYTVVESGADATGYTLETTYVKASDDKKSGIATVVKDAEATVKVINEYKAIPYTFKVTKAFSGIPALPSTFKINVSYTKADGTAGSTEFTVAGQTTTPYEWTVSDALYGAPITVKESGYEHDDYSETTSVTVNVEGAVTTAVQADFDMPANNDTVVAFTNTYNNTEYNAEKVWNDNGDKDKVRPESVKFQLYKNGEPYGAPVVLDGSETTPWTCKWAPLEVGAEYYVRELDASGTAIDEGGNLNENYTVTYKDDAANKKTTVTNSHQSKPVKEVFSSRVEGMIDGKPVQVGDVLTYRITYKNTTGKKAEVVTITDEIPAHTVYAGEAKVEEGPEAEIDATGSPITWTFSDVADGTEIVVSFKVRVVLDEGAVIPNTAVFFDGENTFNSNEVTNSKPEKDVFYTGSTDTIDGQPVKAEDKLTYELTYENTEKSEDGKGVIVSFEDTIPANSTYTGVTKVMVDGKDVTSEVTITPEPATGKVTKLTWSGIKLADPKVGTDGKPVYSKVVVTFNVTVDENNGVALDNEAILREGNNSAKTNKTHNPTSDEPEKTVYNSTKTTVIDGKPVQINDVLTYEIKYKNTTGKAQDVTIEDSIPQFTEYVKGTAIVVDGPEADIDDKTSKITWAFGEVAANTEITVEFKVKVTDDEGSVIPNTGKVREGKNEFDTNEVTNSKPEKDVFYKDTTESIDGQPVKANEELTYELTYENTEKSKDGKGVTVSFEDTIPTNSTYTGVTKVMVDGEDVTSEVTITPEPATGKVTKLTWSGIQLADPVENEDGTKTYSKVVVTFNVTVDENNGVALDNEAILREGNNEAKTNKTHNPTSDEPDKTVYNSTKTTVIDGKPVQINDVLTYEIKYKNTTGKAQDVTIEDSIPQFTEYVKGTAIVVDGPEAEIDDKTSTITWAFGEVAANTEITVEFKVKVTDDEGSVIPNTGKVREGKNEFDTNEVTNSKPEKDVFYTGSTESIDGKLVQKDQKLTYELTYENTETTKEGKGVTVSFEDTIPTNSTYTGVTKVMVDDVDVTNDVTISTETEEGKVTKITWSGIKLAEPTVDDNGDPVYSKVVVTFNVTVDENNGVALDNEAILREGENSAKTNKTHNPVPKDPEKTVYSSKQEDFVDGKPVDRNEVLTYTIKYENTTGEAADVTIEDAIPDNTTYVAGTAKVVDGPAATKIDDAASPITWTFKDFPVDGIVSVTFDVKVNDTVSGETIVNQAVVHHGENDFFTKEVTNPTPPKKDVFTEGVEGSIDTQTVKPGQKLDYEITYKNSTDKEELLYFSDLIPEYTTYVDDSAAITGSADDPSVDIATTKDDEGIVTGITWGTKDDPVRVPKKGTVTLKFSVTVDKDSSILGQKVVNDAIAYKGENQLKTNEVTNPIQTDLLLKKIIEKYVQHDADKVSFGFTITGYEKQGGHKTFDTVIGIDFTSKSNVTEQELVRNLPAETTFIEVTEVYYGGYTPDGGVVTKTTATLNEDGVFEVSFKNNYNKIDYNTGVTNKFDKEANVEEEADTGDTQGGTEGQ